jgi:hypothetical protein
MPANPSCSSGACDMIRFTIVSVDPSTRTALVAINARPNGCGQNDLPGTSLGGTVAEVYDPAGCFFNEPPEQLFARQGWARYMMPDAASLPYPYPPVPEWEVFSLCCGFDNCIF